MSAREKVVLEAQGFELHQAKVKPFILEFHYETGIALVLWTGNEYKAIGQAYELDYRVKVRELTDERVRVFERKEGEVVGTTLGQLQHAFPRADKGNVGEEGKLAVGVGYNANITGIYARQMSAEEAEVLKISLDPVNGVKPFILEFDYTRKEATKRIPARGTALMYWNGTEYLRIDQNIGWKQAQAHTMMRLIGQEDWLGARHYFSQKFGQYTNHPLGYLEVVEKYLKEHPRDTSLWQETDWKKLKGFVAEAFIEFYTNVDFEIYHKAGYQEFEAFKTSNLIKTLEKLIEVLESENTVSPILVGVSSEGIGEFTDKANLINRLRAISLQNARSELRPIVLRRRELKQRIGDIIEKLNSSNILKIRYNLPPELFLENAVLYPVSNDESDQELIDEGNYEELWSDKFWIVIHETLKNATQSRSGSFAPMIGEVTEVNVEAYQTDEEVTIKVTDDGEGIPDNLFSLIQSWNSEEPSQLETTKGRPGGIGLQAIFVYGRQIGARIEIQTKAIEHVKEGEKSGTVVKIIFPLSEQLQNPDKNFLQPKRSELRKLRVDTEMYASEAADIYFTRNPLAEIDKSKIAMIVINSEHDFENFLDVFLEEVKKQAKLRDEQHVKNAIQLIEDLTHFIKGQFPDRGEVVGVYPDETIFSEQHVKAVQAMNFLISQIILYKRNRSSSHSENEIKRALQKAFRQAGITVNAGMAFNNLEKVLPLIVGDVNNKLSLSSQFPVFQIGIDNTGYEENESISYYDRAVAVLLNYAIAFAAANQLTTEEVLFLNEYSEQIESGQEVTFQMQLKAAEINGKVTWLLNQFQGLQSIIRFDSRGASVVMSQLNVFIQNYRSEQKLKTAA